MDLTGMKILFAGSGAFGVPSLKRLLERGASYQRQRAVADANDGDLRAVVDSLLNEMEVGIF